MCLVLVCFFLSKTDTKCVACSEKFCNLTHNLNITCMVNDHFLNDQQSIYICLGRRNAKREADEPFKNFWKNLSKSLLTVRNVSDVFCFSFLNIF